MTGSEMPPFFAAKLKANGGDPANSMLARFGGSVTVGGVRIATVTAMHSNGLDPDYIGGAPPTAFAVAGVRFLLPLGRPRFRGASSRSPSPGGRPRRCAPASFSMLRIACSIADFSWRNSARILPKSISPPGSPPFPNHISGYRGVKYRGCGNR